MIDRFAGVPRARPLKSVMHLPQHPGVVAQPLDAKAARRSALVDDYTTTAWRLNLLERVPLPGDEADKK